MKIADALKGVTLLGFDTSPLIYFVEKHPVYFAPMKTIISLVSHGTISGIGGAITLTEVITQPIRLGKTALVQDYEDILLNSANFRLEPVTLKIARSAGDLRARYNLKTPDALQIATAVETGCQAFLTNDTTFQRVKEIQVLLVDALEI